MALELWLLATRTLARNPWHFNESEPICLCRLGSLCLALSTKAILGRTHCRRHGQHRTRDQMHTSQFAVASGHVLEL